MTWEEMRDCMGDEWERENEYEDGCVLRRGKFEASIDEHPQKGFCAVVTIEPIGGGRALFYAEGSYKSNPEDAFESLVNLLAEAAEELA